MGLTVLALKNLKPEDKGRILSDGESVWGRVFVAKDGAISVNFFLTYKFDGKKRNLALGTWPNVDLAEIRKAKNAAKDAISPPTRSGRAPIDPVAQAQQMRAVDKANQEAERMRHQAEREAELLKIEADRQEALLQQQQRLQELAEKHARLTVRGLFEQWLRLELSMRVNKGLDVQRSFEADVFPLIGNMAAADVTKAHVVEILDAIKARATDDRNMVPTVKKTLGDMRQMFGFALDREYLDIDPTARIKKSKMGKDVERDRVLSEAELILMFQRLGQAGLADTSQVALLLQLSTVSRIGEVLSARWEHVDFERRNWTLPDTKNGKRHEIWLNDFALRQLARLKELTGLTAWLFPATRAKKDRPDFADHVCEKTVTKQVGDRQRVGGEPMQNRTKHVEALVLPGGRWTPHDLRRTGATMMAELGALPDVVERCLNHTEQNKVKRIYQRAQYEGPMREAWRQLGERLSLLEARASGDVVNVVTMRAA